MENKLIEFFVSRTAKISLSVCAILPVFVLIMDTFTMVSEEGITVSFSAMRIMETYAKYGGSVGMWVAMLFTPIYRITFVLTLVLGAAAIGVSFIRKKWASILTYVFATIPTLALSMSLGALTSFAEEDGIAYSMILFVAIMWTALIDTATLTGFICSLVSKKYGYYYS